MKILKKIVFYFWQFTWVLLPNLLGLIVFIVASIIPGRKIYGKYDCVITEIGFNWGGFNLGIFIFVENKPMAHLIAHERGHVFQSHIFGPLQLILIDIGSALRYWFRRLSSKQQKVPYDAIWFEGWATLQGKMIINRYEGREPFEHIIFDYQNYTSKIKK